MLVSPEVPPVFELVLLVSCGALPGVPVDWLSPPEVAPGAVMPLGPV